MGKDFGLVLEIYERSFEVLKQKGKSYESEIPTFQSIKNILYRERKKYLRSKKLVFQTLDEVEVPEKFKPFLMCQDGNDNNNILIFAKIIRSKLSVFFGDGTFRCVPKLYCQLFTDMGSSDKTTNVVPLVYGLLPNKNEDTYIRLFERIKNILGLNITTTTKT